MADEALIAHLLRRTTFGPLPGQVEALAPGGLGAAIDSVLGAEPPELGEPPPTDNLIEMQRWWLGRMGLPGVGLHEKMTWFWHGVLTSAFDKVGNTGVLWTQHLLLREHALGSYSVLLHAATTDPAMLLFLDGAGSFFKDPNENYARELQELFSIGRERVKETNVRTGAKALAGWTVDVGAGTSSFDASRALPSQRSVTFLGAEVNRAKEVVDAVCNKMIDRPDKFGTYLVSRLHRFLVGFDPDSARARELAVVFADSGLAIRPVVEAIVRHGSFVAGGTRLNRPRFPVEWIAAMFGAFGLDETNRRRRAARDLTQLPFEPPNVAGWPPGPRWVDGTFAVVRARATRDAAGRADAALLEAIGEDADPVAAALARSSMYEVSDETVGALTTAAGAIADPVERGRMLLSLVVTSPEFVLA